MVNTVVAAVAISMGFLHLQECSSSEVTDDYLELQPFRALNAREFDAIFGQFFQLGSCIMREFLYVFWLFLSIINANQELCESAQLNYPSKNRQ